MYALISVNLLCVVKRGPGYIGYYIYYILTPDCLSGSGDAMRIGKIDIYHVHMDHTENERAIFIRQIYYTRPR